MKTLHDHVILYDDQCPLCRQYTGAFVSCDMLDKNGRAAFNTLDRSTLPGVDWEKARNEIALVNRKFGEVIYGVASLTTILGNSFPWFKPVFAKRWFQLAVSKLYMFISYNRKVIAPGNIFEQPGACTPDLNYTYRWLYILFAAVATTLIIGAYARLMPSLQSLLDYKTEFLVIAAQLLVQGSVVWAIRRERTIHYLGNLMTILLLCALALTPAFALSVFIRSEYFFFSYLMLAVGFMFYEHWRRSRILGLPIEVTFTLFIYKVAATCVVLL